MQIHEVNLGMSTLIELSTLDENVALRKELGLRFIELNLNLPVCCPERLDSTICFAIREECVIIIGDV